MMQQLSGFVLLDVRTEAEFRERYIPGAILIPVNELERRAAELPDKDAVIFVYCRMGVRASNAARILVQQGFTQVFNIGGIMDWPYETVSGN
jgi:rhodanese-related sulfurtransferase